MRGIRRIGVPVEAVGMPFAVVVGDGLGLHRVHLLLGDIVGHAGIVEAVLAGSGQLDIDLMVPAPIVEKGPNGAAPTEPGHHLHFHLVAAGAEIVMAAHDGAGARAGGCRAGPRQLIPMMSPLVQVAVGGQHQDTVLGVADVPAGHSPVVVAPFGVRHRPDFRIHAVGEIVEQRPILLPELWIGLAALYPAFPPSFQAADPAPGDPPRTPPPS